MDAAATSLVAVMERRARAGRDKHLCSTLGRADAGLAREEFDPSDAEHRLRLARFMVEGRWEGGRSFRLRGAYASVPEMAREMLVRHFMEPQMKRALRDRELRRARVASPLPDAAKSAPAELFDKQAQEAIDREELAAHPPISAEAVSGWLAA